MNKKHAARGELRALVILKSSFIFEPPTLPTYFLNFIKKCTFFIRISEVRVLSLFSLL